jgi:uncharacterized membrane protein
MEKINFDSKNKKKHKKVFFWENVSNFAAKFIAIVFALGLFLAILSCLVGVIIGGSTLQISIKIATICIIVAVLALFIGLAWRSLYE